MSGGSQVKRRSGSEAVKKDGFQKNISLGFWLMVVPPPVLYHYLTTSTRSSSSWQSGTMTMTVCSWYTISELKLQIFGKCELPIDLQRLCYQGEELADGDSLGEHAIHHGSTLHLMLRLRGGMQGSPAPLFPPAVPNPDAQSSPPPLLLSGNLGLVVPEEVGTRDLPMVAISDDVIAGVNLSAVGTLTTVNLLLSP